MRKNRKTVSFKRTVSISTPMEVIAEVRTKNVRRSNFWYSYNDTTIVMHAILAYCTVSKRFMVYTKKYKVGEAYTPRFTLKTYTPRFTLKKGRAEPWEHKQSAGEVSFYTNYYRKSMQKKNGWHILKEMPKDMLERIQIGQLDKALAKGD